MFLAALFANAQEQELSNKRKRALNYSYSGVYLASTLGFHQLWYKNYERSSFHYFNDSKEWLQMDKAGHTFSAFTLTKYSAKTFQWAGYNPRRSSLYASAFSFTFLTTIELMDAHSEKWGFSWGDVIANSSGISIFLLQELLFHKQAVLLKYSYQPSPYRALRPSVLGETELQAMFKDYNAQTYWASINFNDLVPQIKPKWLNLAIGYSGSGMVNASKTYLTDDGIAIEPYRQFFLSLDVHLEKIETDKKWLKTTLSILNCIKVPFPAVDLSNKHEPSFHWMYF
ncbi:MAG: DUF2279 domain-containing protein [Crocinitomicaceae bacterium]|nr:DUF2279 domain-containing protein [Crocinitomicaceae bacterium]